MPMTESEASRLLTTERGMSAVQIPGLLHSSSSVSTSTVDTEIPSPTITPQEQQHVTLVGSLESASPTSLLRNESSSSDERSSSVDSFPTMEPKKGAKRTASGAVKVLDEHLQTSSVVGKTRDRRASELSEQLKTRLKYAMLKVERGWQSQNLEQLEHLSNSNPNSPVSPATRRRSMSSDIYITSPISQASAPSRAFRAFEYSMEEPPLSPNSYNVHENTRINALAPAPRISSSIRKQQNRRSLNDYRKPPSLMRSNHSAAIDRSAPKTPTNTKFGSSESTGFTPMLPNQAEMDAVDSLLFMSSPNNSNSMKKQAGGQMRPPRLDRQNSGKKVNFLLE